MSDTQVDIALDPDAGGLILRARENKEQFLHPLWLRERTEGPGDFDPNNNQRLYDHSLFPPDLKVTRFDRSNDAVLNLEFSDGFKSVLNLNKVEQEIGWQENPEELPIPKSWNTSLDFSSGVKWEDLDDPATLKAMLKEFLTYGFCIMQDTVTDKDSLLKLAGRFGYVRDTHWGKIFNVKKKPKASDSAYTDAALPSHTDNPYREPIPGIQFLHCLKNDVPGGFSTLVDGIAITERLREENPEQAQALEDVNVRFRYDGPAAILENHGPIVGRDHRGIVRIIRLSTKLDFVPALDKRTLDLFYAGRRRLIELSNDPEFQISFPFRPGTLLMMDNYRLLHGRTAFDGDQGERWLQGCYTDHDGAGSLYKLLANGSQAVAVMREA